MKRFVSAILAALLLAVLAGSVSMGAAKAIEVTIWEQEDPSGLAVMDKLHAEFMKDNPDIKVSRVHYTTEELRSAFQNAVLARKGPFLVFGPYDNIGPFSTMGIVQPLDDLLPADFLASFEPAALDGNCYKGKLWAIPDRIGNHLTLVYNKKLLPQPPADTDEMIARGKALTKDTNNDGKIDQYGLVYNLNEPFWLVPWFGGFGGWVMDKNDNPTLDTAAVARALEFVRDLKFKHKIVPPDADYNVADALFKEGKAAMIINGPWSWATYKSVVDMGLARIPKVSATGKYPTPMTGMKGYSLSITVQKKEERDAALKVLMFLTGEHAQMEFLKAHAIGDLPSNKNAGACDLVRNDPMLRASVEQMQVGLPMPIAPEMRAIWDAIRPYQELVMGGKTEPEQAAKEMQKLAIEKIKEITK